MIAESRARTVRSPDDAEHLSSNSFRTGSRQSPIPGEQVTIVPANQASWDDVEAILGSADYCGRCRCQALKVVP